MNADASRKKLEKVLKALAAADKKVEAFKKKHAKIFSELLDLQEPLDDLLAQAKALAQKPAQAVKGPGKHELAAVDGWEITVQSRESCDGVALVALNPKILRLVKDYKIAISMEEVRRLRAAKVVTKKMFEACVSTTPAISISPSK